MFVCVCVRESKRDSCMRMSIVCVCVSLSSVFEYVCCQRQRSLTIFYERAASRGSRMNKPFLFYVFQEIGTQKIYALFLSGICVLDVCVCVWLVQPLRLLEVEFAANSITYICVLLCVHTRPGLRMFVYPCHRRDDIVALGIKIKNRIVCDYHTSIYTIRIERVS